MAQYCKVSWGSEEVCKIHREQNTVVEEKLLLVAISVEVPHAKRRQQQFCQ
jgi:hypothetical protein